MKPAAKIATWIAIACLVIIAANITIPSFRPKATSFKMRPAEERTSGPFGLAPTAPAAIPAPVPRNPGCISGKLGEYKPKESRVVYHHPSLIQYAKLAISDTAATVSLTFMEYVSLMSAYKFLKPEQIMFHTYTNIAGKYWDMIQEWNTSIVMNKVKRVVKLGSRTVPSSLITHQADFVKVRGLLEFGGTISDFDVIIIDGQRWKQMQRSAECVISREYTVINAGFNSCIKNSSFVRRWLNGYHTDYKTGWLYNAAEIPTRILKDNSSDSECYNMLVVDGIATHPAWNLFAEWLKVNGVNWKKKVAAHYFNADMKQYNETHVSANNSFGELLRYVLNT